MSVDTGSETSSVSSKVSSIRSLNRRIYGTERLRIRYDDSFEFILIAMSCILPPFSFHYFSDLTETSMVNYMVILFVFALPSIHMQLVMGQYTQLSCSKIGIICPIIKGVEFTFIIAIVLRAGIKFYYFSDSILMFLLSLQPDSPWLTCPKNSKNCWEDRMDCTSMCINDKVHISSFIYYINVFQNLKDEEIETEYIKFALPNLATFFISLINCVFLYLVLIVTGSSYQKFLFKMTITSITLGFILLLGCTFGENGFQYLGNYFKIDTKHLFNAKSWAFAINKVSEIFGFGRGLLIIFGGQMPAKRSAGVLSTGLVATMFIWLLILGTIEHTALLNTANHAKIPANLASKYLYSKYFQAPSIFTVLPQGIKYFYFNKFCAIVLFADVIIMCLCNQLFYVLLLEKCIIDIFPKMVRYRIYTLATIMFAFFTVIYSLSANGLFTFIRLTCNIIITRYELINVFLFSVTVMWIYGVTKFSDDIHFLMGSQPAFFWKITWLIMPLLLILPIYEYCYLELHDYSYINKIMFFSIMLVISIPILVCAVHQLIIHLKNHNLIGMLRSLERYGPANPDERQLRRLFNPRTETRSRRRHENCMHKCLVSNKFLKRAVEMEHKTRAEREQIGYEYHKQTYNQFDDFDFDDDARKK